MVLNLDPRLVPYCGTAVLATAGGVLSILLLQTERKECPISISDDFYRGVIWIAFGMVMVTAMVILNESWVTANVSLYWPCVWFGVDIGLLRRYSRLRHKVVRANTVLGRIGSVELGSPCAMLGGWLLWVVMPGAPALGMFCLLNAMACLRAAQLARLEEHEWPPHRRNAYIGVAVAAGGNVALACICFVNLQWIYVHNIDLWFGVTTTLGALTFLQRQHDVATGSARLKTGGVT